MVSTCPGSQRDVNGVSVRSTLRLHVAADEGERLVRAERARKQAGLGQDLEAVADPEHEPASPANRATAAITGEKRAIAPQRR